ncbi:MAG: carboxypeptidase-like regulatory domain-containing protein, partial [Flavobacteriales bacterium]|nr:carboxypeptidase-like regulatory domain-containing protein [Flavobacteriales bacterium]
MRNIYSTVLLVTAVLIFASIHSNIIQAQSDSSKETAETNRADLSITQRIRGSVKDKESKFELVGATVAIYTDSILLKGVATDVAGIFKITDVPIGRYNVVIKSLGYTDVVITNVIVNSAKEVLFNVEMEESMITMEDVVISGNKLQGEASNQMATVSARTFSVEETERYAGSRGDPARMASNFAGVQGADDSRNDIVVRGNSPLG